MSNEDERLQILEMVDKKQITVEQAVELLAAISGGEVQPALAAEAQQPDSARDGAPPQDTPQSAAAAAEPGPALEAEVEEPQQEEQTHGPSFDPARSRWRSWWWIPMGVGVSITVCGALFMYLAWQASGLGFWFVAACLPFLLGVALMALAWSSRKARWLHIRVQQPSGESPQRIAISLPLPLRPLSWLVRIFRPFIPKLQQTGLDELILALEHSTTDQPVYIEVNESESGEHVEVYLG